MARLLLTKRGMTKQSNFILIWSQREEGQKKKGWNDIFILTGERQRGLHCSQKSAEKSKHSRVTFARFCTVGAEESCGEEGYTLHQIHRTSSLCSKVGEAYSTQKTIVKQRFRARKEAGSTIIFRCGPAGMLSQTDRANGGQQYNRGNCARNTFKIK